MDIRRGKMKETAGGPGNPPGQLFPAGFPFNPPDEQWILIYLYKRQKGMLTESEKAMVVECDPYGDNHPWEIWEMLGGEHLPKSQVLFFFTRLKRKGGGFKRTVGWFDEGLWEQKERVSIQASVEGEDNKTLCVEGIKKKFRYSSYQPSLKRWFLHEYTLNTESNHVAICLLRQKDKSDATKSTGQGNAEILETRSAKNKRKPEFDETACTSNETLHKNKKLNIGGPPIAPTAPVDQFPILESSHVPDTTGPDEFSFLTDDCDFLSDWSMDFDFSAVLQDPNPFCPTASSNHPQSGYPAMENLGQPEQPTMEQQPQYPCTPPGNHPTPPPYYSNYPTQEPSWYPPNPSTIPQTTLQTTGYDSYGQQPQVGSAASNLGYSYSQTLPVASQSYSQGYRQQPPTYGQNFSNQFTNLEQQNLHTLPIYGPPNVASQQHETVSSEQTQPASAYPPLAYIQPSFTSQPQAQSGYDQTGYNQTAYGGLQQSLVPPSPSTIRSMYGQGGYSVQPTPATANYDQGTHPVAHGQLQLETQQLQSQPTNDWLSQPLADELEATNEHLNADQVSDPAMQKGYPRQS